jgi:5'-nucleotidase
MRSLISSIIMFALLSPLHAMAQTALTILHTSEHRGTIQPIDHGAFTGQGGVERRASLIKQVRKEVEHLLIVDSGDLFTGTALPSDHQGEAAVAAMNLMGYDAVAVGNHDFDFGARHLQELHKAATFPFLCSNVRPQEPDTCARYIIKTLGALRIGLIALIGKRSYPDAFAHTAVREVEFHDPIAVAKKTAEELRDRVDLLVAITHQDTEEDLALAKEVPALDVIIGGHAEGFDGLVPTGTSVPVEGRVELAGAGPVFVKTHRQGRTLGRLDLVIHDKTIMVAEARNLPVTSTVPSDPEAAKLVQEYAKRLDKKTNAVIGEATQTDTPAPGVR